MNIGDPESEIKQGLEEETHPRDHGSQHLKQKIEYSGLGTLLVILATSTIALVVSVTFGAVFCFYLFFRNKWWVSPSRNSGGLEELLQYSKPAVRSRPWLLWSEKLNRSFQSWSPCLFRKSRRFRKLCRRRLIHDTKLVTLSKMFQSTLSYNKKNLFDWLIWLIACSLFHGLMDPIGMVVQSRGFRVFRIHDDWSKIKLICAVSEFRISKSVCQISGTSVRNGGTWNWLASRKSHAPSAFTATIHLVKLRSRSLLSWGNLIIFTLFPRSVTRLTFRYLLRWLNFSISKLELEIKKLRGYFHRIHFETEVLIDWILFRKKTVIWMLIWVVFDVLPGSRTVSGDRSS